MSRYHIPSSAQPPIIAQEFIWLDGMPLAEEADELDTSWMESDITQTIATMLYLLIAVWTVVLALSVFKRKSISDTWSHSIWARFLTVLCCQCTCSCRRAPRCITAIIDLCIDIVDWCTCRNYTYALRDARRPYDAKISCIRISHREVPLAVAAAAAATAESDETDCKSGEAEADGKSAEATTCVEYDYNIELEWTQAPKHSDGYYVLCVQNRPITMSLPAYIAQYIRRGQHCSDLADMHMEKDDSTNDVRILRSFNGLNLCATYVKDTRISWSLNRAQALTFWIQPYGRLEYDVSAPVEYRFDLQQLLFVVNQPLAVDDCLSVKQVTLDAWNALQLRLNSESIRYEFSHLNFESLLVLLKCESSHLCVFAARILSQLTMHSSLADCMIKSDSLLKFIADIANRFGEHMSNSRQHNRAPSAMEVSQHQNGQCANSHNATSQTGSSNGNASDNGHGNSSVHASNRHGANSQIPAPPAPGQRQASTASATQSSAQQQQQHPTSADILTSIVANSQHSQQADWKMQFVHACTACAIDLCKRPTARDRMIQFKVFRLLQLMYTSPDALSALVSLFVDTESAFESKDRRHLMSLFCFLSVSGTLEQQQLVASKLSRVLAEPTKIVAVLRPSISNPRPVVLALDSKVPPEAKRNAISNSASPVRPNIQPARRVVRGRRYADSTAASHSTAAAVDASSSTSSSAACSSSVSSSTPSSLRRAASATVVGETSSPAVERKFVSRIPPVRQTPTLTRPSPSPTAARTKSAVIPGARPKPVQKVKLKRTAHRSSESQSASNTRKISTPPAAATTTTAAATTSSSGPAITTRSRMRTRSQTSSRSSS
jgi:hypothetical protein